jgi:hypothetical protein
MSYRSNTGRRSHFRLIIFKDNINENMNLSSQFYRYSFSHFSEHCLLRYESD